MPKPWWMEQGNQQATAPQQPTPTPGPVDYRPWWERPQYQQTTPGPEPQQQPGPVSYTPPWTQSPPWWENWQQRLGVQPAQPVARPVSWSTPAVSRPTSYVPPVESIGQSWPWMQRVNQAIQSWTLPAWLRDLSDWARYVTTGTEQRLEEAWRQPEERELTPARQYPSFAELYEQATQQLATLPPEKRPVEALKLAAPMFFNEVKKAGVPLGQAWEQETAKIPALRRLEQVGALGLGLLGEAGKVPKTLYGAGVVASHPEAEGLTPEQWAPIASVISSLGRQQLAKASVFKEGLLSPNSTVGQALRRVKAGEDPEAVAASLREPIVETIVEIGTDPLNLTSLPRVARTTARTIARATGQYATAVEDAAEVSKALDQGIEAARAMDELTRPAQEAGLVDSLFGKWDDLKQAVSPAELTASSKVSRDTADAYMVASNLIADAGSTEEAARRLKTWIANPGKAARELGEAAASEKGRQVARMLGGLNLDDLETLKPGRPFDAHALGLELAEALQPGLEEVYGVKPLTGYRKFAEGFKRYASEFYMNLNPRYAVTNAVNNASTLAYDGILALDSNAHLDDFLARWGPTTSRAAGRGGGAVQELGRMTSKLPWPLKGLSEAGARLARTSAIGEETFYKRGLVGALRKTWGKIWHSGAQVPDLPPQLAQAIGPERVAEVKAAVASGVNLQEITENVARVANPRTPGEALGLVMRYANPDQIDDLSPATWRYLQDRITMAQTPEEARAAIDEVRQAVKAQGDLAYRRELLEPTRTVFTGTADAEALGSFADDLAADAAKMGLDPALVRQSLDQAATRLTDLQAQLAQASGVVVGKAGGLADPGAAELVYRANRGQEALMDATRASVDELRKATWEEFGAQPWRGGEIWDNYFRQAAQQWEATFAQRLEAVQQAGADLDRLANGEALENVAGLGLRQMQEERIGRLVDLEGVAAGDLEQAQTFTQRLNILRARVDTAQGNAWRVGLRNPTQEALDILDSADRYTQDVARKWRAESDALRNAHLSGMQMAASKAERTALKLNYREAQDKLAQRLFNDQVARWRQGERELRQALVSNAAEAVRPTKGDFEAWIKPYRRTLPGEAAADLSRARAVPGAAEQPTLIDLVKVTEPRQLAVLDGIEQGIVTDWAKWQPRAANIFEQRVLDAWLREAVAPAWRDARMTATQSARVLVDRALLDYSQRNRFDEFLNLIYPYNYWYTRSGINWFKRLANDPAKLVNYLRYKKIMEEVNRQRGLRQRFEGKVKIPLPEGITPDWMEPALYVDPVGAVFPFAQFDRTDWDDDEQANDALTSIYQTARRYGLRPYAFLEVPLQYAGLLGESKEDIGNLIPQTAYIRGATALAGAGPAGGVNIEAPIRKAAGLTEQEPWDPYRVNRMLASMAGDDPDLTIAALNAQELQTLVNDGKLELREATGESGKGITLALKALQEQHNWSDDTLTEAQAVLREALQRAAIERGIPSLASLVTGMPGAVVATGEEQQLALQRAGQAQMWGPENLEGSRAQYETWRAEHPEVYTRFVQYQAAPGEQQPEWMTPAVAANLLQRRAEREQVEADYNHWIDDLIRDHPEQQYEARALLDQKLEMLAEVDTKYPLPASEEEWPADKAGQTPQEYARAVLDQELAQLNSKLPKYADFESGTDYTQAVEKALAGLPATSEGLALALAAGATQAGTLRDALEAYRRRYDTPLQALQKVYFDDVYWPAMDRYYEAKAQDEAQWPGMADLEDQYFDLSKGNRSAFLEAHPRLKEYWDYKDRAGTAWERTVGAIGPIQATDLINQVLARNFDRGWTADQLATEYAGVRFPAGEVAGLGRLSPEERAARETGQGTARQAQPKGGKAAGALTAKSDYEQKAERVRREGWRAVYGLPWWEKYPRRGGGGGGGGGGSSYAPPYWINRRNIYGGPFRG
jgi:hypothetical protein